MSNKDILIERKYEILESITKVSVLLTEYPLNDKFNAELSILTKQLTNTLRAIKAF